MATLKDTAGTVAERLRDDVDRLVTAIKDDAVEFADVGRLAATVGETASVIGGLYSDLDEAFSQGLRRDPNADQNEASQETKAQGATDKQLDEGDSSVSDEVTKDDLLEHARELNLQGRSAMSKDELREALAAEEAVTKDELLERAREAGIEGRSTMTKAELRDALQNATPG